MNEEIEINEFSPLYNSEADSLKAFLLSDANSPDEKVEAVYTFSETFTVHPSLIKLFDWPLGTINFDVAVFHLVNDSWARHLQIAGILSRSVNQYCEIWYFQPSVVTRCLWDIEKCKLYLQFPHSMLKKYYQFFHRYSSSPLPKEIEKKYRQSLILYDKIKAVEIDNEKWLECLKEANDPNFIIHNLERRIGSRPHDKEMWKLYIKFLRNSKLYDLMYHTYSRYCSLFTDDLEMRKEFKTEIESDVISSSEEIVSKWKLKIVKIERDFGTFENAIALFNKYFQYFENRITTENFDTEFQKIWAESDENPCPTLNKILNTRLKFPITRTSKKCIFKNDAIRQTFALPSTAMNFMIKNAKFEHLKKLYGTSKHFFARSRSQLCFKILIGLWSKNTVTFEQNLCINSEANDDAMEAIKKCHVKDGIHIEKMSPIFVSTFIRDKIYKCEIATLSLENQTIYMEDFLKIISNVQYFFVYRSHVFDYKNQNVSIPEIIAKMPIVKVTKFERLYNHPPFPATSKVPKMERKLERFEGNSFMRPNDPAKICEFLNESITSNAIVDISYRCDDPDEAERAKICIFAMFESWKNDETFKPKVTIEVESNLYSFP